MEDPSCTNESLPVLATIGFLSEEQQTLAALDHAHCTWTGFVTKQLINLAFTAFINSIYSMELLKLWGCHRPSALVGNQAQRMHGWADLHLLLTD